MLIFNRLGGLVGRHLVYRSTRTMTATSDSEPSVPSERRSEKNNVIAMPAVKNFYELDIDPRQVDLVKYDEELFDNRVKKLARGRSMARMTQWRKDYFLKRLRRTISSPISLRNLSDSKEVEVFTQRVKDKNLANADLLKTGLIDSPGTRSLKHHNFLQHLMSSNFTDNAQDYDDEAEAWADMIWHRNYGSADVTIRPSSSRCARCHSKIHCCDIGLPGYVPKERFAELYVGKDTKDFKCQRCIFSETFNTQLGADVSHETYSRVLSELGRCPPSIICLLVDLVDFPSGLWEGMIDLIGTHHRIIVVGNKLDLIPYDGPRMIDRVTYSLSNNLSKLRPGNPNLHIKDVILLSARTGFGVERLVSKLLALTENSPKDIYLLGCSNSGKSTLFSALLQSDLSAIRKGDLITRVSSSECPGTNISSLKFPVQLAEGWEIELKKQKSVRVQRNTELLERSLENTTKHRQAQAPHMSMLIDRLDYLPPAKGGEVLMCEESQSSIRFTQDHPLVQTTNREPLSATREEFPRHGFFWNMPSCNAESQLHDLLTNEERLEVFPHEQLVPRAYTLRPLQSILLSGLARLDLLTSVSYVMITMYASKYLPIHVMPTKRADEFYNSLLGTPYLGVPFGDQKRLKAWPKLESSQSDFLIRGDSLTKAAADIILTSAGWAAVTLGPDQDCIIRAHTPAGRGIFLRQPSMLPFGSRVRGKKIRDTPLFMNPHYVSENMKA